MPLTEAGRDFIAAAIVNAGPPVFFDNSNAYLGVGSGDDAFDAEDTDLQGGSTFREAMEATYPQRMGNVLIFRSVFGESDANFAWEEWGVFNADTAGTMLNRAVESLGTKTGTESRQLTATITVEIGEPPE